MTFGDYVGFYKLARSEGLVLRYLSDAFRAAAADDPGRGEDRGAARPHRVARRAGAPGRLEPARRVGGDDQPDRRSPAQPSRDRAAGTAALLTANPRAFRVLVRNELFRRVQLAALEDWDALGELDAASGFDADAWADAMDATSTSTTRSAPAPMPAARRCS